MRKTYRNEKKRERKGEREGEGVRIGYAPQSEFHERGRERGGQGMVERSTEREFLQSGG